MFTNSLRDVPGTERNVAGDLHVPAGRMRTAGLGANDLTEDIYCGHSLAL